MPFDHAHGNGGGGGDNSAHEPKRLVATARAILSTALLAATARNLCPPCLIVTTIMHMTRQLLLHCEEENLDEHVQDILEALSSALADRRKEKNAPAE